MTNLKHADALLADIARDLKALEHRNNGRTPVGVIEVAFCSDDGKEIVTMGLGAALDALANDIYWNEEANWSDAQRALVRTI